MRDAGTMAIALLLFAGCLGSGEDGSPADGPDSTVVPTCPTPSTPNRAPGPASDLALPVREGFETTLPGGVPRDWSVTDGTWGVETASTAPEGRNVLRGQGDGEPGFSSLLIGPAGSLSDFTATLQWKIGCVDHPHGIGVVLHVQDEGNYQIVRYSASESAWDVFTVKDGTRERHEAGQTTAAKRSHDAEWSLLRVTSQADRIQAFDGDVLVIDHQVGLGNSTTGQVGLFLRGNSDALFDELAVDDLDLPV